MKKISLSNLCFGKHHTTYRDLSKASSGAHIDSIVLGGLLFGFSRFGPDCLFSGWLTLRLGLAFSGFGCSGLNLGSGIRWVDTHSDDPYC
jgi:hypothetical protein